MEQDIAALGVELAEARLALTKTKTSLSELQTELTTTQEALTAVEIKIAQETKKLSAFMEELKALDEVMKLKKNEMAEGEISSKGLEMEIEKLKKEQKGAVESTAKMEKTHDWISNEHQ